MLTGKEYFYPYFEQSVRTIAQQKIVIDIGTTTKFRKELKPFRKFFRKNYFALDYQAQFCFGSDNVDIDASIYNLPFKDNALDALLCISVLEHLADPCLAAREIYRVLRPQGKVFLTVPFILAEHSKRGDYEDYYRFTESGVKQVFHDFSEIDIVPQGGAAYCRLTMFPFLLRLFKNKIGMKIIQFLDGKTRRKTTPGWMINLKK